MTIAGSDGKPLQDEPQRKHAMRPPPPAFLLDRHARPDQLFSDSEFISSCTSSSQLNKSIPPLNKITPNAITMLTTKTSSSQRRPSPNKNNSYTIAKANPTKATSATLIPIALFSPAPLVLSSLLSADVDFLPTAVVIPFSRSAVSIAGP